MSLPKSTFVKVALLLLAVWFVSDVEKRHTAAAWPLDAAEGPAATYQQDLAALKRLRSGLFKLADDVSQRSDLFGPRAETDPTLLRQDLRKAIYTLWYPILDSYLALDVLAEKHMNFYLLERREWYLTNIGIPGFWTHAALFIGSAEQREALSHSPDVEPWLARQGVGTIDELIQKRYPQAFAGLREPYSDGHPVRVIEAISAGVVMTSLEHSATCDSLAVLRPRLTRVDRAAAVVRAMRFYGRPYDFDFDFVSDAQLVCTELIFKSYLAGKGAAGLTLPLEQVMGHMVTPANALAQQFDAAFGTDQQQMEMVLFLDGLEKENRAVEADVLSFRGSWYRPKWHILLPSDASEG